MTLTPSSPCVDSGKARTKIKSGLPRQVAEKTILAAAERVFGQYGFRGASVNDIAQEAGVPKPNILYYFGTKEQLYRSVLENILTVWLHEADHWLVPEREAHEGFEGYIRAKMSFSYERPYASKIFAYEVLQGATHIRHYLETTLRQHIANREKTFALWRAQGQMTAVDSVHLMFAIWSMTQSYADMGAQMSAVLGKDALTSSDFEEGVQTILRFVVGSDAGVRGKGLDSARQISMWDVKQEGRSQKVL